MAQTEVRQGRFVYRDALFVEVEGDKRHARASATELKDLLLPRGINATASPRDQVGHFYQAQLIHYGIPFTRDKRGAKLRLIEAINSKSLQVPANVRNIEADLKKQYTAEVRKVKTAAKRDNNPNTVSATRKRKAANDETTPSRSSDTKVSIKVGDVIVDVDHSSTLGDKGVKQHRRAASDEPDTGKSAKKRKIQGTGTRSSPLIVDRVATSPSKTHSSRSEPRTQRSPLKTKNNSRMPQTGYRSRLSITPDNSPPPYSLYDDNNITDNVRLPRNKKTVVQISGSYILTILNSRADGPCSMRLYPSNARDQLWGTFAMGNQIGVLRLDDVSDIANGAQKTLGWRAEYTPTGRLKFGTGCDGRIQFDGNGGARGCFNGLMFGQDITFEAVLDEGFGYQSEDEREYDVIDLVNQWDDFPTRAYGR